MAGAKVALVSLSTPRVKADSSRVTVGGSVVLRATTDDACEGVLGAASGVMLVMFGVAGAGTGDWVPASGPPPVRRSVGVATASAVNAAAASGHRGRRRAACGTGFRGWTRIA